MFPHFMMGSQSWLVSYRREKGDATPKLKFQLWANMIHRVIENFMAALQSTVGQSFTKNDLLNVKQLSGYGITCSGHGMFQSINEVW